MIIDKNTNPKRDIYYLGGLLLEIISKTDNDICYFDAYLAMKKKENISIKLFSLTLDWLFLINVVDISEGRILKCF